MTNTFNTTNFNQTITDGYTNSGIPTDEETDKGIPYNSLTDVNIVNKFLFNISSAIKYIQESGAILWQKNKQYPKGSVVNIVEKVGNSYTVRKFKCIKVDSSNYTTELPLIGGLQIDNSRLVTYFDGQNTVNTTYWEEINENDMNVINYNTLDNGNKYIKIIVPSEGEKIKTKLGFQLERFNTNTNGYDKLNFSLFYNYYKDNAYVEITDMICDNFVRKDTSVITDPYAIFGTLQYHILGFGIILTDNNELILEIKNEANAYINNSKNIKIQIKSFIDSSSINVIETTQVNTGLFLPIRSGSNSKYLDTGYVVETSVPLSIEDMFRRGLMSTLMNKPYDRMQMPNVSLFNMNTLDTSKYSNKQLDYFYVPYIHGDLYAKKDIGWRPTNDIFNTNSVTNWNFLLKWSEVSPNPATYKYMPYTHSQSAVVNIYEASALVTHGPVEDNLFNMKQKVLSYPKKATFDIEHVVDLFPRSIRVYRYLKY